MKDPEGDIVEKNKRVLVTAVIMAVMSVLLPSAAFAAETYQFRDDQINIDMPDDAAVAENEVTQSDGDVVITGPEMIFGAKMKTKDQEFGMDLYYVCDESVDEDYFYLGNDSEEAAGQYYDGYGEEAIRRIYSDIGDRQLVSLKKDGYHMSDWYTYIKASAKVKDSSGTHDELVFITAASTDDYTIGKVFILEPETGAVSQKDMEDSSSAALDSFFDYGYDKVMAGEDDEYYAGVSEDTDIAGAVIFVIVGFVMLAVIFASIAKKKRRQYSDMLSSGQSVSKASKRRAADMPDPFRQKLDDTAKAAAGTMQQSKEDTSKPSGRKQQSSGTGLSASKTGKAVGKVGKSSAQWKTASGTSHAEKHSRKQKTENVPCSIHNGADERYMESLRTLYKSGLLTRQELDEMIEKHKGRG